MVRTRPRAAAAGPARRLSQIDAFFVAYQEAAGIAMQLGVDVELEGEIEPGDVEAAVERLAGLWPHLGQTLHQRIFGLAWDGPVDLDGMLGEAGAEASLERWHNTPIDPFREPPFQALWLAGERRHAGPRGTLALRAHHAALDGQSFHAVAILILRLLAGGGAPPAGADVGNDLLSFWRLLGQGRLGTMWRHLRAVARESRSGTSARLALRATAPGDVAVHQRRLDGERWQRLVERGRELGINPAWLCCAAWVRAIGAWNAERGETGAPVSLEVPVSVRRGRIDPVDAASYALGNCVSPLILSADAGAPAAEIAGDLQRQIRRGLRQRAHLAMPLFTAPGRYLPWGIFRRAAADTTFSGFATSHFTWLEEGGDLGREISRLSGGRLAMKGFRFRTPVCLHMGAALMAVPAGDALQLSITHRLNALSAEDAAALADLLIAELPLKAPAG